MVLLEQALQQAETWKNILHEACLRIEIAGGIRRNQTDVNYITLVALPFPGQDLFGNKNFDNTPLDQLITELKFKDEIKTIKSTQGHRWIQPRGEASLPIDIFVVLPPAQHGVTMVEATGPASYWQKITTPKQEGGLLPGHLVIKNGSLSFKGKGKDLPINIPTEKDFYEFTKIERLEPWLRK